MTRVFVVDDTGWFRSAARAVIAATEGFEFAGASPDRQIRLKRSITRARTAMSRARDRS